MEHKLITCLFQNMGQLPFGLLNEGGTLPHWRSTSFCLHDMLLSCWVVLLLTIFASNVTVIEGLSSLTGWRNSECTDQTMNCIILSLSPKYRIGSTTISIVGGRCGWKVVTCLIGLLRFENFHLQTLIANLIFFLFINEHLKRLLFLVCCVTLNSPASTVAHNRN